jgi:hypothetical protein
MENQSELDPIEKMMIVRLADFFINNMNYDLYHNPHDFFKEGRFWTNIAKMVDGEKYLNNAELDNGNFKYNPSNAISEFLISVRINHRERFPELLQFIIDKLKLIGMKYEKGRGSIPYVENKNISTLNRYLSVFALSLDSNSKLTTSVGMIKQREDDRLMVFGFLNHYPDEKASFLGAISRFADGGDDAFRQSLSSCRTLIENLTKKIVEESDWNAALSKAIQSDTKRDLIKKIHHYLSAYGSHGPEIPSQHDTELGIKLTEDVIVWLIKSHVENKNR